MNWQLSPLTSRVVRTLPAPHSPQTSHGLAPKSTNAQHPLNLAKYARCKTIKEKPEEIQWLAVPGLAKVAISDDEGNALGQGADLTDDNGRGPTETISTFNVIDCSAMTFEMN